MRPLLASLAIVTCALSFGAASTATAGPPSTTITSVSTQAPDDTCGDHSIEVARWLPSRGPAARFIADHPSTFIALGRTGEGLWSTQWTTPTDACDDCDYLELVFTRFSDGKSKRYLVVGPDDRRAIDRRLGATTPAAREAALKEVMIRRLWRYAATVWPAATMRHDYAVVTPQPDPSGGAALYRGWLVGIAQGGHTRLRFTTDRSPFMCWCHTSWRSFVPKR